MRGGLIFCNRGLIVLLKRRSVGAGHIYCYNIYVVTFSEKLVTVTITVTSRSRSRHGHGHTNARAKIKVTVTVNSKYLDSFCFRSLPTKCHWGHGHGHGHGIYVLATHPEGIWTTNPKPSGTYVVFYWTLPISYIHKYVHTYRYPSRYISYIVFYWTLPISYIHGHGHGHGIYTQIRTYVQIPIPLYIVHGLLLNVTNKLHT